MEITEDVKPTEIYSAVVYAPFDKAKRALERKGYKIISLEENSQLRMQQGVNHNVSRNGNWVREGVLYVPGKGKFLTKNSPIMQNPVKATDAHRNGNDFYLNKRQVESALEDSMLLSLTSIPTNRFGEDEITSYAFGENAKQYGEFLNEAGVDSMSIYPTNSQDKPFVRQMWFGSLVNWSELGGGNRDLDGDDGLRGVKFGAEGTHPKNK